MATYDPAQIKSDNSLVDVISGYIELKKNGREYIACCPFHSENTPSFTVVPDKDFFHCMGCGAHDDAIGFVQQIEGVSFVDACKILGGEKVNGEKRTIKRASKKIEDDTYKGITPILPVPSDAQNLLKGKSTCKIFNPKRADDPNKKWVTYKPSMVFPYHDLQGALLGYVLRIDFGDGKKITPTITYCNLPDGAQAWTHCSFPAPRPLYGAQDLTNDKPILICEGEKAADAAKRLLGNDYTCLSWNGGTQVVAKSDWTPLAGKRVLIWCDNDEPGINAVLGTDKKDGLVKYLTDAGVSKIKYLNLDVDKEKGWDVADAEAEGMNREDVIKWAKSNIIEYKPPAKQEEPPAEQAYEEPPTEYLEANNTPCPFRLLGHNRGTYYYLPDRSQQIVSLTAAQHTTNNLIAIAPLSHWEMEYTQKTGFDLNAAVNAMININYSQGLFDPHEMLRGRGAWMDDNRAVLHLGSKCYVDGVEHEPRHVNSRFIYENQSSLSVKPNEAALNKDANQLPKICEQLSWENKLSAAMLVGWCVVAPVCGILRWRPHIWITGPSGSGKSTVIHDIMESVIGGLSIHMEGKTTEAGIRQQLCQDARPIVFDEFEGEDPASLRRVQGVLDLARVASSGGQIFKGSQSGIGVSFSIRSCFCFSSINTSIEHFADESRITKLILKKDTTENAQEKYNELDKQIKKIFTPEYSAAMLARSVQNLPVLQQNVESFVDAATRVFKSRRLADQMGALLAGYYLCFSVKPITPAEAEIWLKKQNWTEFTDITNRQDEQRLLDYISTRRVRVEDSKGFHDVNIGELILCANNDLDIVDQTAADRELKRRGIMVDFQSVLIANNCQPMKELLKGTAWSSDWARPLKDLYNADTTAVKYFAPGIKSRAVELPLELFKDGE